VCQYKLVTKSSLWDECLY